MVCGGYTYLATPKRTGGDPLQLAFCWAHGRRKLIKAKPQKGSPIVDEALLRITALYKIEDAIRGSDPDHRRAVRRELAAAYVSCLIARLAGAILSAANHLQVSRQCAVGSLFNFSNPNLADGTALFHASRGNIGAANGPSLASLTESHLCAGALHEPPAG